MQFKIHVQCVHIIPMHVNKCFCLLVYVCIWDMYFTLVMATSEGHASNLSCDQPPLIRQLPEF